MYIAFKWLVGLSMAMWIAICLIDIYKTKNERYDISGSSFKCPPKTRNRTLRHNWDENLEKDTRNNLRVEQESIMIHYLIFAAGAIVVSIFHRKNEIILFTKDKVTKNIFVKLPKVIVDQKHSLNSMAAKICVACRQKKILLIGLLKILWNNVIVFNTYLIIEKLFGISKTEVITNEQDHENEFDANLILLTKVKEIVRNTKLQLTAAINEDADTLESTRPIAKARNELIRKIDEHHNQLRQTNNLQHLYVITRHENIILKNRIKKISQEKNAIERDFVILVNKVFCSENNNLKKICSRFIVSTNNNLVNSDVEKEIKKYSGNSSEHEQASTSKDYLLQNVESDIELYTGSEDKSETGEYPNFRHISSDVVWTVKGRDGIIEKLYEYSFAPIQGESVRRIREYSVYFEKDRLMSRSIAKSTTEAPTKETLEKCKNFCQTIKNRKFLTESPAFKKFLTESRRPPALME